MIYCNAAVDCSLCGLDFKLVCVNKCSFPDNLVNLHVKSAPSRF